MHSMTMKKLADFPGFAIRYDPSTKPYFQSQVVEALRKIQTVELGRTLLKGIADARPKVRAASKEDNENLRSINFVPGINVVIVPWDMTLTQSGFTIKKLWQGMTETRTLEASSDPRVNVPGCPYHQSKGSHAEAVDRNACGDGTGCTSVMRFTNAQVVTNKGEYAPDYIVLAHELIHSLHHVTGTKKSGQAEELWTSGLKDFADEPMSENAFRKAFGLKPRQNYY